MKRRTLYFVLFCLAIGATLLNNKLLGSQPLVAYFSFALVVGLTSAGVAIYVLFTKQPTQIAMPVSVLLFGLLTLYVFIYGLIIPNRSFLDYYWFSAFLFLAVVSVLKQIVQPENDPDFLKKIIFDVITLLAFLESLTIFSQALRIFSNKMEYFLCTGTWGNPNVSAIFLSMNLFAIIDARRRAPTGKRRLWFTVVLLFTLSAILLLKCRTAFLVSLVVIVAELKPLLNLRVIKQNISFLVLPAALFLVILIGLIWMSGTKHSSTEGRVTIWQNCLALIRSKPGIGYGFGRFEKIYNEYTVEKKEPRNDYITYAYNDFLFLGVEGGAVAVFLWALFILFAALASLRDLAKPNNVIAICVAFLVVQSTNFGIQSMPGFIIFLTYIGLQPVRSMRVEPKRVDPALNLNFKKLRYGFSLLLVVLSGWLLFTVFSIGGALRTNKKLQSENLFGEKKDPFIPIEQKLKGYPAFHENYGTCLLNQKKYDRAAIQFNAALENSSDPQLYVELAFCFEQLKKYDSSVSCYTKAINLQPYRFMPRLLLLNVYVTKKDTSRAIKTAQEMISLPEKIRNGKAKSFKAAARSILELYESNANSRKIL